MLTPPRRIGRISREARWEISSLSGWRRRQWAEWNHCQLSSVGLGVATAGPSERRGRGRPIQPQSTPCGRSRGGSGGGGKQEERSRAGTDGGRRGKARRRRAMAGRRSVAGAGGGPKRRGGGGGGGGRGMAKTAAIQGARLGKGGHIVRRRFGADSGWLQWRQNFHIVEGINQRGAGGAGGHINDRRSVSGWLRRRRLR